MEYLRVKNWREFQHYKDRNPTFVKLHLNLLNDVEYLALPDKAKLVLVHCWIAAGNLWNPKKETEPLLPFDSSLLRVLLHLSQRLYLDELVLSGFLIPVPNDYNNLRIEPAIKSLAKPEQVASPEAEVYRSKKQPLRVSSNGNYPDHFEEVWIQYNRKGAKRVAYERYKRHVNQDDLELFKTSITNYLVMCQNDDRKIRDFAYFIYKDGEPFWMNFTEAPQATKHKYRD